jgi:Uma2 family endonuclease
MAIAHGHLTLEQFLELPEEEPALEYYAGEVVQKMSPETDHSMVQSCFSGLLNDHAKPRGLGIATTENRLTSDAYSLVPDISFFSRPRVRRTRDGLYVNISGPPDIAIEILSPGQRVNALIAKCYRLLELGSRIVLLVESFDRTVMEFRRGATPILRQGDDRIDLDEVLPGLDLTVSALFDAIYPDWVPVEDEGG